MPRERGSDETHRRRFLKATGATALTAAAAGCSGDSGGTATETEPSGDGDDGDGGMTDTDTPTTTETTSEGIPKVNPGNLDSYPWAPNETAVSQAQKVMEQAGYGPDNRYELDWLQYTSPSWKEMANTIRSRLSSAYIDMNISEAGFGPLIENTQAGKQEAYTLGWIADYPGSKNFLQLIDPPNTDYSQSPAPNGAALFFTEDAKADPDVRDYMVEQFDRIQNNPEPTDEAQQIRDDATVKMEKGMWASNCMIPVYHRLDEVFWYDRVDYRPPGGMGGSRAKTSTSVRGLEGQDRLGVTNATFSSLDPVASGNTASGSVIMDVFDAPMNYVNGTTEVEGLLVESFEVNDDLTEYTFTLKEGVQFQGDWGEVTADDVVYSIRRVVESPNTANSYFTNAVLDIVRETDDDGNVVPGSTGVEATGDYEFTVELNAAFGFAVPVLAYSAFSAIPEGIVGDIEGYDGEMDYETFSTSPVGSGPFTLENWESGDGGEVILDAYADYHGQGAAVDGVDQSIITDPNASHTFFLNGNADVSGIPTSKYDPSKVSVEETLEGGQQVGTYGPLSNGETVNYAGIPTINTFYVGFNMEKVPEAVRRAMAYVVNKDQFVQSVFKGRGEAAFHLTPKQVFPGGAQGYDDHWQ